MRFEKLLRRVQHYALRISKLYFALKLFLYPTRAVVAVLYLVHTSRYAEREAGARGM